MRKVLLWILPLVVMLPWVASIVMGQPQEQIADWRGSGEGDAGPSEDSSARRGRGLSLELQRLQRGRAAPGQINADPFMSKANPVAELGGAQTEELVPALPFTYLGKISNGDVSTVFLLKENQNYNVKVGDVVEEIYRIDDIVENRIELTYLPRNAKQTLYIGPEN